MPHSSGGRAPYPQPEPQCEAQTDMTPTEFQEARGCLFALSQPPLMLFLAVIGGLLFFTALHDLFLL